MPRAGLISTTPNPLDASLTAAEKLLRERGRLYKILADSHDLIPALLQAKVNAAAASAASEVFTS